MFKTKLELQIEHANKFNHATFQLMKIAVGFANRFDNSLYVIEDETTLVEIEDPYIGFIVTFNEVNLSFWCDDDIQLELEYKGKDACDFLDYYNKLVDVIKQLDIKIIE